MSKNKNNRNNRVASLNPTDEVMKLEAELNAARERAAAAAKEQREALAAKVNELPAMFGVATIAEVVKMIRSVNRGTGTGKRRLSDETRQGIRDALTAQSETSEAIASRFGVSIPTVQVIKKELGLVKARTPKVVAS